MAEEDRPKAADDLAAIAAVRTQIRNWTEPYASALDTVCRAASRAYAAETRVAKLEAERDAARKALDERKVIERAKGIVMERGHVSEDRAYRVLRLFAMKQARTIPEISAAVVAQPDLTYDLLRWVPGK